jgi:hypothetical protein
MSAKNSAEENELQERLLLAVLEPLTNLPIRDLQQWHFRQSIFTHLDKHIDTVIECSRGRENVARHHLILMLFKIINRLLGEIDCGQTDAQYEREAMKRYETAAGKAAGAGNLSPKGDKRAVSSMADKPVKPENLSGTPDKPAVSARRLSQEASAVAHRERRARMTEEELNAFRALAAQRQRERRARLKSR